MKMNSLPQNRRPQHPLHPPRCGDALVAVPRQDTCPGECHGGPDLEYLLRVCPLEHTPVLGTGSGDFFDGLKQVRHFVDIRNPNQIEIIAFDDSDRLAATLPSNIWTLTSPIN